MQFRLSFLLVSAISSMLLACSGSGGAARKDDALSLGMKYERPEHAQLFRWRSWQESRGCLEILNADSTVMATIYRDSSDYLADALKPEAAVVLDSSGAGLATMSSTHVALMEPWDSQLGNWSGGGYLKYIRSEAAQRRVRAGNVLDFGGNPEWNHEAILAANFKAFCTYPFGNPLQGVEWAKGFAVVPVVEYEEPTPLGRAEWMRALAWLIGDAQADSADLAFAAIADRYQDIQRTAPLIEDPLVVLTGSVEQGAWTAPNGNSFVAQLIEDAGGQYIFSDAEASGNVELSLEALYSLREKVDVLGLVLYERDTAGLSVSSWMSSSPHHKQIVPESRRVFAANTMTCDYFGWWVAHPDALLANVRKVLYPDSSTQEVPMCFELLRP